MSWILIVFLEYYVLGIMVNFVDVVIKDIVFEFKEFIICEGMGDREGKKF